MEVDRPRHRHLNIPKRVALLAGFVMLILLIGGVLYNVLNSKSETSPGNQVKSVFSNEEMIDYDSPENKFSIKLPGFPAIDKRVEPIGDREIPVSTYKRVIENDTKIYLVEVYDYTGLEIEEAKILESEINNSIQNTPGSKVNSIQKGIYNGSNMFEADYTFKDKNNKTQQAYSRYIMRDSRMYVILLTGSDRAKFDELASSLQLQ